MENNQQETIDLRLVVKKVKERKKLFFITLPIVFILSCIIILSVPRYYVAEVKLAPESDNSMSTGSLGSLGSLASSFGLDFSEMKSSDAISPILYPELMEDNGFVCDFFDVPVENLDSTISTDYYHYLKDYQESPWWGIPFKWIGSLFKEEEEGSSSEKKALDPYNLTEEQNDIADAIRGNILLSMDKKTSTITISVTAQDPKICKTLADSMKTKLQGFITEYRTSKSRNDLTYYLRLEKEAKKDYEAARLKYGKFADTNKDVVLVSYQTARDELENDMQLKYNTYSSLKTQVQIARAKVQAKTPVFTAIKGAEIPVKPAGPKRMIFVLGMMFLATIVLITYVLKDEFKRQADA